MSEQIAKLVLLLVLRCFLQHIYYIAFLHLLLLLINIPPSLNLLRFPAKSSSTNSVFGAPVTIKIPILTVAEDDENTKSTRDTMGFFIFNNGECGVVYGTVYGL